MINSSEESIFENEQKRDFIALQNHELRLNLVQELNAALTFHNDGINAKLELKHTFPMGVGMFES
jgi:hypothetical protein